MDLMDLQRLCSNWNQSNDGFARIVAATVATLGLYQRELAAEFNVAESTVSRWAKGVARPHPIAQKSIVAAIERRARNALRARGPVRRAAAA